MSTRRDDGLVAAVGIDLRRLHDAWLGLAFPQYRTTHPVVGRWTPRTASGRVAFRIWSALGVPAIAVGYPVAILGLAVRFHVRRFDRLSELLGILGVIVVAAGIWGALAAVAHARFSYEGFVAVAAAGGVATASAAFAVAFSRVGGRATSILLAYPLGVTAVLLPPVVAALYSPALADVVFTRSTLLAKWLLDTVLAVGGIAATLRANFDLVGVAYVAMWFAIAVPVGWLLGVLVAVADAVRPAA